VAFEDAAVEASARAAERSAARRGGVARQAAQVRRPRAGGWLPLASSGPPLAAMIWKNVVAAFRTLPLTTMLVVLALAIPLAATLGAVPAYARHARTIGTLALIWTASLVAFGPQFVRNDLRQDLPRLAVLRSYPLDGREVVLAQLTASALVLTALIAPAVAVVYLAYVRAPTLAGGLLPRTALLVATLAALPVVSALALTVQNAAALLFPTWVRLGPTQRASGFEASGQNMVVTLLSLALLGVLLLAPALVVVVIEWALRPYLGIWAMAPAFPGGLAIAIAELWWVVGWLGGLFERTEPSEIG
jgi:hypothetical protein